MTTDQECDRLLSELVAVRAEATRLQRVIDEYLAASADHDEATADLARARFATEMPPLWRRQAEAAQRWATARIALLAAGRP